MNRREAVSFNALVGRAVGNSADELLSQRRPGVEPGAHFADDRAMRGISISLLVLTSCGGGTTSRPVTTPNGRAGYTIECESGTDCYARAGQLCPNGYDVLDSGQRTENNRVANAFSSMGASISRSPAERHTVTKTQALIECRDARGPERKTTQVQQSCSRASRTGVYETRYSATSGTCGPLAADIGRLRNADPDPPSSSCKIEKDSWSSDGCELERTIRCESEGGWLWVVGRTRQNDDGSILSGAMSARMVTPDGGIQCEGVYTVQAQRKSL